MQIVKQKKTKRYDAAPTTSIEEYIMREKSISGATAIVSGRYPEKGYATNLVSYELVLVLSGNGYIGTKRKKRAIELGDCLLLKPKEKYYWLGHMALFMVTTPAWNLRQHKIVKK
ncbi:MAG TPA: hypothetical protein VJB96_05390 [Patescibacteria group bacterium]|nr:hypothetical protein [Patescibacteria group bacterium]